MASDPMSPQCNTAFHPETFEHPHAFAGVFHVAVSIADNAQQHKI